MTGLNLGGLALASQRQITGINLAGVAVSVGNVDLWDFSPTGSLGRSPTLAEGVSIAAYRVQATELSGLAVAGIMNRSENFTGLGISAYNAISGMQTGVTIGIFNYAGKINGIQIGLLNHVASNPPLLRWLPIFNTAFGDPEPTSIAAQLRRW